MALCACSNPRYTEDQNAWDCSIVCAEASEDSYIITYSDKSIVSDTGTLSVQNRNDFDIVIHLLTNGQKERTAEIAAGGVAVLYEISEAAAYTIGCHADVADGIEIELMVYDGDAAELYLN